MEPTRLQGFSFQYFDYDNYLHTYSFFVGVVILSIRIVIIIIRNMTPASLLSSLALILCVIAPVSSYPSQQAKLEYKCAQFNCNTLMSCQEGCMTFCIFVPKDKKNCKFTDGSKESRCTRPDKQCLKNVLRCEPTKKMECTRPLPPLPLP